MNNNKQTIKAQIQKGFTMIEILIVIAIMAILIAVGASYLFSNNPTDKFKLDKELIEGVPNAIVSCHENNPTSLATCTSALITTLPRSYFSNTTTACGDTWSVAPTASQIVWTYPLDTCTDNDVIGASYATKLSGLTKITATYDNATDDLTITILR
jgi:prepilin-type N-terminal cleavage/methylation domain-containing protein